MSWRQSNMSWRQGGYVEQCEIYKIFGDCFYGAACNKRHDGSVPSQKYFYCTADRVECFPHMNIRRCFRDRREISEQYYVGKYRGWHRAGARSGDYVLFQASSIVSRKGNLRHGRVVRVLRKSGEIGSEIPVESEKDTEGEITVKPPQKKVYTIDQPETKRYDDAFSIDDCGQHSNCKHIGIHISACALEDPLPIRCERIPARDCRFPKNVPLYNLQEGKVALVLSIFVHTKSDEIFGPVFSQVEVEKNYFHSNPGYEHHFRVLWSRFARESEGDWIFNDKMQKYMARYPDSWKERYVVEEMMTTFHSTIRSSVNNRHFITKVWEEIEESSDHVSVSVFKDVYEVAKDSFNSKDPKILALASCGMRLEKAKNATKSILPKYCYDVEEFSNPDDSKNVILCTSTLRKFFHYVNQQILIGHMMSRQVYAADQLRGMLGIRFETPQLGTAQVKKMDEDIFELEYLDMDNLDEKLCEVPYAIFSKSSKVKNGNFETILKGLFCRTEEYCNRDLVHIEGESFRNFLLKMTNMDSVDDTAFGAMEGKKDEEQSPYRRKADDTILKLQAGVQLQLQISKPDAIFNPHLGIRLLRVGRNRHLCLSHLNHPELAFMSERKDVRKFVTSEKIAALKKDFACEKKSGVILDDVKVQWGDAYYSGGSFTADGLVVKEGAFICIRSELMKTNNMTKKIEVEYVWCCHGVVSAAYKDRVEFSLCTLSQSGRHPDTENFCVEIVE